MTSLDGTASARPSLLGLSGRSSRDFSEKKSWGKNQFNNCFPASLAYYMHREGLRPVYLTLDSDLKVSHGDISVGDLFGADPDDHNLFFSFESQYTPYSPMVKGRFPGTDLVTMDRSGGGVVCLRDIEIKLTALPDNSTFGRPDDRQSSEIVVRPDTLVYAVLAIADGFKEDRETLAGMLNLDKYGLLDWSDTEHVKPLVKYLAEDLDNLLASTLDRQTPLMMQPIWKTVGKTLQLAENCFDIFVWSNFAFTRLFVDSARAQEREQMTREMRSVVWMVKMLNEYAVSGSLNPGRTTSKFVYAPRTDKAFAVSGARTHQYLCGSQLTKPRIERSAVKEIILGGGEKYLSPERRLDAVIQSTYHLL